VRRQVIEPAGQEKTDDRKRGKGQSINGPRKTKKEAITRVVGPRVAIALQRLQERRKKKEGKGRLSARNPGTQEKRAVAAPRLKDFRSESLDSRRIKEQRFCKQLPSGR